MIPPWQQFPEIPFGSIGWRMGYGEEFWDTFDAWFKAQTSAFQKNYSEEYPEPSDWRGFYKRKGLNP